MTDLSSIYPLKEAGPITYAEPSSDAPLGDIFTAAERAQRLGGNVVSEAAAREEAYDRRIEAIRQVTGVTLENPERFGYAQEARAHLRQDMLNGDLSPIDESAGVAPYRRRVFDYKVAELQAKHPDLEFGGVDEEASALGTEAQQNLARATAQPGNPILKFGAELAGGLWGSRRDPLFLGSLFAGPSTAVGRTAFQKIATSALGQGVFNAGLTGGEQYVLQDWLAKIGKPTGIGPAAEEMGSAFLGGVGLGVLGGAAHEAIKAATPSIRRLLRGQPEPGDIKTATEALAPQPAPPAMAPADIVAGTRSAAETVPPGRQMLDSDSQPMPGKYSLPISDGGKEVGYLEYAVRDGNVNVRGSTITEESQGKGLGVAAYKQLADWALANGMEMHSMGQTSAQAKNVYAALERRGYTVEKDDGAFKITKGPAVSPQAPLPERAMRAGEDSLAADKAVLGFHGSPTPFTEFDPDKAPFFFSPYADEASAYALNPGYGKTLEAAHVVPSYLRMERPYEANLKDNEQMARARDKNWLRENGYDSAIITHPDDPKATEFAVLDPSQITPRYSELHDDLVAAALKRADDPEAPSPEAVAATTTAEGAGPELAARIEQANPRNPREAMAAADQALDDFGRRDGMAELKKRMDEAREAQDETTEAWRNDEDREAPGRKDIRHKVPMVRGDGTVALRSERAVRSDGDIEALKADLIRSCK